MQETDHDDNDKDCGTCSPFFTCAGCSGFTATIENVTFDINTSFSSHRYTGYVLSSISDVHYDFWQPPKLNSSLKS
jgi:hypothetical protein